MSIKQVKNTNWKGAWRWNKHTKKTCWKCLLSVCINGEKSLPSLLSCRSIYDLSKYCHCHLLWWGYSRLWRRWWWSVTMSLNHILFFHIQVINFMFLLYLYKKIIIKKYFVHFHALSDSQKDKKKQKTHSCLSCVLFKYPQTVFWCWLFMNEWSIYECIWQTYRWTVKPVSSDSGFGVWGLKSVLFYKYCVESCQRKTSRTQ